MGLRQSANQSIKPGMTIKSRKADLNSASLKQRNRVDRVPFAPDVDTAHENSIEKTVKETQNMHTLTFPGSKVIEATRI